MKCNSCGKDLEPEIGIDGKKRCPICNTEHTIRYCHPCEHLKFENALYGSDFVHGEYVCHHPEANEFGTVPDDPRIAAKLGEMQARIKEFGRLISKHKDRQPAWCPLIREKP